jgi:hypothetical protein
MQLSPEAQRLFLYLLSSPHSNSIGLYVINKMYICADLNITDKQLNKPFKDLEDQGLILYDSKVNLLLIVNHLKHNKIENEKQAIGAKNIVEKLPKSQLYQDVIIQLPKHYHKPLVKALKELYAIPEEKEKEKTEEGSEEVKETLSPEILVKGWNDICGDEGLTKVIKLTPERRSKVNARIRTHSKVEFWTDVINEIPCQPFLMGKNDRKWKADFDWLMANDTNAVKVLEGKYKNDRT